MPAKKDASLKIRAEKMVARGFRQKRNAAGKNNGKKMSAIKKDASQKDDGQEMPAKKCKPICCKNDDSQKDAS